MANELKVTIKTDNIEIIKETLAQQIQNALWAVGATAEGYAKEECPVDTGRLRNSITHATKTQHNSGSSPAESSDYSTHAQPDDKTVAIGTNVEYAVYVENGDFAHTVGNKHFLKHAVENHTDEYKSIIEAALKA